MQPQAIDGKRANNVAIGLAQFKAFASYDELFGLVSTLGKNDKLDAEKLENLKCVRPVAGCFVEQQPLCLIALPVAHQDALADTGRAEASRLAGREQRTSSGGEVL
jgi:hypothetical protein